MSRRDELPKILSESEEKRLVSQPNLRCFSPHRDYIYMRLMLKTGLRVGEAVALKPEHLTDLDNQKTATVVVRCGKGSKDRKVGIPNGLREELLEWMDRREDKVGESEYLLPTSKGTQVDPNHLRRSVKRYARKADINEVERVSPHTLRHTFATRLYEGCGNLQFVKEQLGHSDLSTTMIYLHCADNDAQQAVREHMDDA